MEDFEQNQSFQYVKEKVKERPINRRKLLRRTMITAGMAVIFGLIACLTFLLLEPVFSNWLYPEEGPALVEIPQDTEETLPQDMIMDEESILKQEDSVEVVPELEISDYQVLYQKLHTLTAEIEKSLVTVTGVSQDMDWFNAPYESKGQASGVILADNGKEILVLTDVKAVQGAEDIRVTFVDGEQKKAEIKAKDNSTGLVVISVEKEKMSASTLEKVKPINLGSSRLATTMASPVIALGRPLGNQASAVYGMITSTDTTINLTDCNYKLLTTDIYGSTEATGILVDMSGYMLGIINQNYNAKGASNLISAIGITEIKKTLERMSNGIENTYLGVRGTDVPEEIHRSLRVPKGAYITGITMDSPAMNAGIQNGDVIIQFGEIEILSFNDLTNAIREFQPEQVVKLVIMRQGQQLYREVDLEVTLGRLE